MFKRKKKQPREIEDILKEDLQKLAKMKKVVKEQKLDELDDETNWPMLTYMRLMELSDRLGDQLSGISGLLYWLLGMATVGLLVAIAVRLFS